MGCWLGEMKCCSMELEIGCSQGITYRWDLSINLTWTTLKYHQSHTKGKLKYHQSHTQKESYYLGGNTICLAHLSSLPNNWEYTISPSPKIRTVEDKSLFLFFCSVTLMVSLQRTHTHLMCVYVHVGCVRHTAWAPRRAWRTRWRGPKVEDF